MKTLIVIAVLALGALIAGAAAGGGSSEPAARPGLQTVYDRIGSMTDCTELQTEFDQASTNHQRDKLRHRLDLMKIDTGYMGAADDRMRAIGCYK